MSAPLAPTREQYPIGVTFDGVEKGTVVKPTKAVLKEEYMAGGFIGDSDTLLALSHNKDYLSTILTDTVKTQITKDPEVFKCITVIKNGVLGDGLTFDPPVPEPIDIDEDGVIDLSPQDKLARAAEIERYNLAKKYADFAARAFENLSISWRDTADDLLDAMVYGNRVAEKIFEPVFDPDFGKELLTLKTLKVKPRKSTVFVTDKFYNLVGFRVYMKKVVDGVTQYVPKVLDKDKFVVFTYGGKDGDPRGNSILESVYRAWALKQELWPEYLRWLVYSSIPPIVGYTSGEVQSKRVLRDATTNELILDESGNPMYESDVPVLLKAITQIRNATAIALPFGSKVEAINSSVSGDPFKGFRDVLNEEIEMGLILQTLATSDSRHNTRAASQTHISILDDLVWKVKGILRDIITHQILKHLMLINFPDFDMSLLPVVSLGDIARREFSSDTAGVASLTAAGYIGDSQRPGIDRILGLPPRNAKLDRQLAKQKAKDLIDVLPPEVNTSPSAPSAPKGTAK